MIKSETVLSEKIGNKRKVGAEATIEFNNATELLNELMTLIEAFEKDYPEILQLALRLRMEEQVHDN